MLDTFYPEAFDACIHRSSFGCWVSITVLLRGDRGETTASHPIYKFKGPKKSETNFETVTLLLVVNIVVELNV